MSLVSGDESQIPLITVVEYLESSMSKDLLYKFPDNSAFDFDYTQSSIWSPLLPPPDSGVRRLEISRKISFDEVDEVGLLGNTKKMAARMKRKFTHAVLDNISMCHKMKRKRRKSFGFSPSRRLSSSSSQSPKVQSLSLKFDQTRFAVLIALF